MVGSDTLPPPTPTPVQANTTIFCVGQQQSSERETGHSFSAQPWPVFMGNMGMMKAQNYRRVSLAGSAAPGKKGVPKLRTHCLQD